MATFKVTEGTQVHREGVTHEGGQTFTATEDDEIALWLKAGWIEPASKTAARKSAAEDG